MKEYIEKAALIDDFKHCGASKEIVDAIVSRINLHKAADVVEVRHGYWRYSGGLCYCSECGEIPQCFEPDYCPHYGCRMDKEDLK